MAKIQGTNLSAPITPFTDQDTFPTHYAKYGKGGYRTVQNIGERNSIPEDRLEEGMLVWVIVDPSGKHLYQLQNNTWVLPDFSAGNNSGIKRVPNIDALVGVDGDFAYIEEYETIYVKKSNG